MTTYHEGTEEVECGNCHTKVDIDNLASLECITDCKEHKDHDCELQPGYVHLKFTSCGCIYGTCQEAIIYGAHVNKTVDSSSDGDSMDDSNDDDEVGNWYTNRDGPADTADRRKWLRRLWLRQQSGDRR